MPNDPTRVEIITGHERRRRYISNEKLALVDAMQPGMRAVRPSNQKADMALSVAYLRVHDRHSVWD
jgi:hypothetical protein